MPIVKICMYIYAANYPFVNNHSESLKYAHENNYLWDDMTCVYAAENGKVECLKYAHENNCP